MWIRRRKAVAFFNVKKKMKMKKNFKLFIMFLFVPISAFSQLTGVGVNTGGSFSTFEYGEQVNNVSQFDNGTQGGGTGGLRFDFDLNSEFIKLSPEFFFVQNGSKEYYVDVNILLNDVIKNTVSLNYIGLYVPITFYLPLADDGDNYNGILIQGRLFADYAISGEVKNSALGSMDIEFDKGTDKLDFGYSIEGGFVSNGLKLSLGYNWGVKNIEFTNAIGGLNSEDYLINNKGLTLQIGYWQKF